jgi:hypothetical protein
MIGSSHVPSGHARGLTPGMPGRARRERGFAGRGFAAGAARSVLPLRMALAVSDMSPRDMTGVRPLACPEEP